MIITGTRQTGKTLKLINDAAGAGGVIVCYSAEHVKHLKHLVDIRGLHELPILSINDFRNKELLEQHYKNGDIPHDAEIFVDDAIECLNTVIRNDVFGTRIVGATVGPSKHLQIQLTSSVDKDYIKNNKQHGLPESEWKIKQSDTDKSHVEEKALYVLKTLERINSLNSSDYEKNHSDADDLIMDLLNDLGYESIVNEYEKIYKQY